MRKTNSKFFILALILVLSSFNHLFAYKLPPMPDDTEYNQFLKNQKDKAIYLAINTDINCFNDWCYIKGLMTGAIYPHKLGIYLGKIIFEKNKQGNLAPKYLPSNIENLEQELEKINPLWLDELNKDYVKLVPSDSSLRYGISLDEYKPNNIKTLCKKSKHNITLTKEQALSYIREIHTQNTQIIQAYIDEILKNYGLKPYVLSDEFYNKLYDELAKEGIIPANLLSKYNDGTYKQNKMADLIVLDFLAKQNRKNEDYIITFDDELFYAYLVWSLKEYVLNLAQGMLQDNISLLFNPAAYTNDTKFNYREMYDQVGKKWNEFKTLEAFKIITTKYDDPNSGFFSIFHENVQSYFPTDGIGLYAYGYTRNGTEYEIVLNKREIAFKSPNNENEHSYRYEYIKHNNKTIFEPVLNLTINHGAFKFSPSPLGKYYFELTYQEGIYLELIQPYYPTNPPKGWSKEMMKKLDLKLE